MKIVEAIDYSFQDFPGKYSMVLFFKGCNLRCDFCYNKAVVDGAGRWTLDAIRKKLDRSNQVMGGGVGVVFSGGEPTVAEGFKATVRELPGPKAIHTNGLFLPEEKDEFEVATISLKPARVVPMEWERYIDKINRAIEGYRRVIITWVDLPGEDPTPGLNRLEGDFIFQRQQYKEV